MTTTPDLRDFRVLFQYLDGEGRPHFEFTTVLADSEAGAALTLSAAHADDYGFLIVQTVESNGELTGYTPAEQERAVAEHAARFLSRADLETPLYAETVREQED